MNKPLTILLILIFSSLFLQCKKEEKEFQRSVYFWKKELNFSEKHKEFLISNQIKHIYTKFFDVKLNAKGEAYPVAEINFVSDLSEFEIIPVVFITVDVFKKLDSAKIKTLSKNISTKINQLSPQKNHNQIQFDCDWTPSIKDKYFYFLSEFKTLNPNILISSTIRLYQYKYPDLAGIPPVDKGALMYYNMGNVKEYTEKNSILNNEIGKQYIGFNKYPLPIDFALPHFSWAVLFRYREFVNILPTSSINDFDDETMFLKKKENWFQLISDTVYKNTYLRYGDEIKFESCAENELSNAIKILKNEINQNKTSIIVYDFQPEKENFDSFLSIYSFFERSNQ